jgi:hypothetical protein
MNICLSSELVREMEVDISILLYPFKRLQNSKHFYLSHGERGSVVVKALCYKPEGRGFDTR